MGRTLFRMFRESETRIHELNYLFWECTTRCNLACRHCGSDCTAVSREKDMPLADFLSAIDTLPQTYRPKGFSIVLTGGEPLLRPDIVEIGRALVKRRMGWGMVSNGWFYDSAMQDRLVSAGMSALTISLDGVRESHDWMRCREGSYERTLRAIRTAASCKLLHFDVVTCVNKRTYRELDQIYGILKGLGVPQWRLFTIIPIGRAASDPEMHLSDQETRGLMEFIQAKRRQGGPMEVTFSCEGYLGKYDKTVRGSRFFCRAGINVASVLIDGRICACPNVDRDEFSQGSIYKDNFYEVWEHRFQEFRDRSWARTGPCADCPAWRDCLGNGMHNHHGPGRTLLTCHYRRTL